MYIEKIKINKFRVLEDIEVRFQGPDLSAVEEGRGNGNVVNVIAGVNGTGKSSLLEAIFIVANNENNLPYGTGDSLDYNRTATIFNSSVGPENGAKVVLFPAKQSYKYEVSTDLKLGSFVWISDKSFLGDLELYVKEFIVSEERKVRDADPEVRKLRAISQFNQVFEGFSLQTQLVDLDSNQLNKPVFRSASGARVPVSKLSDGEKLLYGRVMLLLAHSPVNSTILIDEPEIALHPRWQQKIMQLYSRIGTNNQFIVATHSPQVIASVPYENRIVLRKEGGQIKPVYCHQPPSGVDVNSILAEVMGADPRPKEVIERYQRYRQLVEQNQENSEEAQELRGLLVNDEGEHSRFMQEMAFFVELRDAA